MRPPVWAVSFAIAVLALVAVPMPGVSGFVVRQQRSGHPEVAIRDASCEGRVQFMQHADAIVVDVLACSFEVHNSTAAPIGTSQLADAIGHVAVAITVRPSRHLAMMPLPDDAETEIDLQSTRERRPISVLIGVDEATVDGGLCRAEGWPAVLAIDGESARQRFVNRTTDVNGTSVLASFPRPVAREVTRDVVSERSEHVNVSGRVAIFGVSAVGIYPDLPINVTVSIVAGWRGPDDGVASSAVARNVSCMMGPQNTSAPLFGLVPPAVRDGGPMPARVAAVVAGLHIDLVDVSIEDIDRSGCRYGLPDDRGACVQCFDGQLGRYCNMTCPCTPNVTGTCSGGVDSDGTCSSCTPGRYGLTCDDECRCVAGNSRRCFDGPQGTGFCECRPGFGGLDCDDCDTTHFGPSCQPCLCDMANGVCDSGVNGRGTCATCFEIPLLDSSENSSFAPVGGLYAGPYCNLTCPGACPSGEVCTDGATGTGRCAPPTTAAPPTTPPPTTSQPAATTFAPPPPPPATPAPPAGITFVSIALTGSIESFNRTAFGLTIASAIGIPPESVRIDRVVAGSVLVRFSLVDLAGADYTQDRYETLVGMLQRRDPAVADLGVEFVSTAVDLTSTVTQPPTTAAPDNTPPVTFAPTPAPPAVPVRPPPANDTATRGSVDTGPSLAERIGIGIGVGVAVVIILVVAGLAFARYVHKARKEREAKEAAEEEARLAESMERAKQQPPSTDEEDGAQAAVAAPDDDHRSGPASARGEAGRVSDLGGSVAATAAKNRKELYGDDDEEDGFEKPAVNTPAAARVARPEEHEDREAPRLDEAGGDGSNFFTPQARHQISALSGSVITSSIDRDEAEEIERQLRAMEAKYATTDGDGHPLSAGARHSPQPLMSPAERDPQPEPGSPLTSLKGSSAAAKHATTSATHEEEDDPDDYAIGKTKTGLTESYVAREMLADFTGKPAVHPVKQGQMAPRAPSVPEQVDEPAPAAVVDESPSRHDEPPTRPVESPDEQQTAVPPPAPAPAAPPTPPAPPAAAEEEDEPVDDAPPGGDDDDDDDEEEAALMAALQRVDARYDDVPAAPVKPDEPAESAAPPAPTVDVPAPPTHTEQPTTSAPLEKAAKKKKKSEKRATTEPAELSGPATAAAPKAAKPCKHCGFLPDDQTEVCPVTGESHKSMREQRKKDKKAKKERLGSASP